jgi:hypothetical protein
MFEEGFPAFPHPAEGKLDTPDYLRWLNEVLDDWGAPDGYEALELQAGATDAMNLFVVLRTDADRALALATELGLPFIRPLDFWDALAATASRGNRRQ